MVSKVCVVCNTEKSIDNFYDNYRITENVNHVISKEGQDGILKTKKKYQININYIMKKIEMCYLQGLKYINKKESLIHNK